MEELDQVVSTVPISLDLFKTNAGNCIAAVREGYEEPDDAGDGEEHRRQEETIVVSELGDGGGGGESTGSTSDFVENMLEEVGSSDEPQDSTERYLRQ